MVIARLTAAAIAAVIVLAACDLGGASTDKPAPHPAVPVVTGNLDPDRQAPAPEIKGAVSGGVVTVLSAEDAGIMDPTESYSLDGGSILSGLVTRSLTQYVYDPDQDTMILIPDIATDLGRPNDDYTQWTYTIRPGIRFEDGTEVTADDVAYGIKRSFDREQFPSGATYSNDYFLDGDTYAGPYRDGTGYDGIEVDGNTLTLKMDRPFPDMPYWGSFPAIGPIPQDSNPDTYPLHPLATGPYKFAAYAPNKSLTLVRNRHWDADTDPGRHNYPDKYVFDFRADAARLNAAILADTGDAQTTVTFDTPPTDVLRSALADSPELLTQGPTQCVHLLALDYRKISDVRVRKAVGSAFPYEDFIAAGQAVDGVTNSPGRSLLPVGTPGRLDYNPLSTRPDDADPDKSRALLEDAGYSPGEYQLSFVFLASDPFAVATKDALVKGFEAGGFAVHPYKTTTDDEYGSVENDPNPNTPINLRHAGWCSDWPSGSSSVLPLLASDANDPAHNLTYFDEPTVDAEIGRIRELPVTEQPAAWGALDKQVETTYYPFLVTDTRREVLLHGSRIGGMAPDSVYTTPSWKNLYVIR